MVSPTRWRTKLMQLWPPYLYRLVRRGLLKFWTSLKQPVRSRLLPPRMPHQVSSVILGLESLLRPFTWKMALIPILPAMLLDFLEAPIPLLAGVSRDQYEVALQTLSP